jgi:hypothetical protein
MVIIRLDRMIQTVASGLVPDKNSAAIREVIARDEVPKQSQSELATSIFGVIIVVCFLKRSEKIYEW